MTDRLAKALYGDSKPAADMPRDVGDPQRELAKVFYSTPTAPAAQPEPGAFFDRYLMFKSQFAQHADQLYDQLGVGASDREAGPHTRHPDSSDLAQSTWRGASYRHHRENRGVN
jgi:hypothetical protein